MQTAARAKAKDGKGPTGGGAGGVAGWRWWWRRQGRTAEQDIAKQERQEIRNELLIVGSLL